MIKHALTLLLICALIIGLSVPALAVGSDNNGFVDVVRGKRYYDGVLYCLENGIMNGISDKLFMPGAPLTRAQLASALYSLAGSPDTEGLSEPFADVSCLNPARKAIMWVFNSGLMQGVSTHFFVPEGTVSRGQLVSVLYSLAGSPAVSGKTDLRDEASIPSAYRKAAIWAYSNGIITDFCKGCFGYALPVTRAQMAVAAEKYCRMAPAPEQPAGTEKLRVVTMNVAHCQNNNTGRIDYDAFAEYLESLDADIIALNEVRGKGLPADYDDQAAILAERLGYHYYFSRAIDLGGIVSYGNAVLTRLKIKTCETIRIPRQGALYFESGYEPRCLLKITLAEPELTVLVSHFGINDEEQKSAVRIVLDNIPDGSCIFMGDLNVEPDNSVLDPIRAKLTDVVSSEEELFTYPADVPGKRIDYIFLSPDIAVSSVYVSPDMLSDHLPLIAEIELSQAGQ